MTVRAPADTAIYAVGDIHGHIDLDSGAYRRGILASRMLAAASRGCLQT